MAVILDTSILIELERRRLTVAALGDMIAVDEVLGVASMTLAEMFVGTYFASTTAQREEREAFIDHVLQATTIFDFDLAAAQVHARVWAELRRTGITLASHDLIIGATAIAHDCEVLTHNVRDFSRIPGLTVRQPSW